MPRSRLTLYLPFVLLAVVCGGWSIFWWIASSRLSEGVETWLAREAEAGRVYACGSRTVGGFPFRLEIDCAKPTARLPSDDGAVEISAARLHAVAQIYRPTHVIGQFEGPLNLVHPKLGQPLKATWTLAAASFNGSTRRLEDVSFSVENLDLRSEATNEPVVTTSKFQAHGRSTPDVQVGAYDVIAKMDAASVPLLDGLLGSPAPTNIELQARVRGLDSVAGGTTGERLQAFAAAGGNLRIALARIERGDVALQSAGQLTLDKTGRPEGELDVTVRGAEKLASLAPALGNLGPLAGAGIKLLGQKATLDGASARRFEVTLAEGVVRLGGLPVGPVPALY